MRKLALVTLAACVGFFMLGCPQQTRPPANRVSPEKQVIERRTPAEEPVIERKTVEEQVPAAKPAMEKKAGTEQGAGGKIGDREKGWHREMPAEKPVIEKKTSTEKTPATPAKELSPKKGAEEKLPE